MQFWYDLLTSPTILIASLLIGSLGEIAKRAVNSKLLEAEVTAYRDNEEFTGGYRDSAKPKPRTAASPTPAIWKRIFFYTLPAQPVLVGVLLGLIPWLPAEESLMKEGYELAGHIGTYSLAGVLCKIGYDTIISTAKRTIRTKVKEIAGTPSAPPSGAVGSDPPPDSDPPSNP